MSGLQIEIQAIAVVTAAACSLLGTFLVLRQMAMLSDAITHAILPGIVAAYFLSGSLDSPLLLLGAAASGLLAALAVELLHRSGRLREDAAIGLVFPVLFSIGVLLISRFASDIHIDTDAVLLGELVFAPFRRVELGGVDLGPQALWSMGTVLVINAVFIGTFYKELQVASFDAGLAWSLGFSPAVIHYTLMSLTAVTAVGAFEAAGSVLVVALMTAPPATASLLTNRLPQMLVLAVLIGIASAIGGYWAGHLLDASIAGCMASTAGLLFLLALLFAPERGLVVQARRRAEQKRRFAVDTLLIHLSHHEGAEDEYEENRVERLPFHLHWAEEKARRGARDAEEGGLVRSRQTLLVLTDKGRSRARAVLEA